MPKKYQIIQINGSFEENVRLEKCKRARDAKISPLLHDFHEYISRFHNKIKEGPYYVCSVCN